MTSDTMAFDATAITAVIGYSEQVKRFLPEKFARHMVIVSCLMGIFYALTIRPVASKQDIFQAVSAGVTIGLAASGGYSGMKRLIEKNTT